MHWGYLSFLLALLAAFKLIVAKFVRGIPPLQSMTTHFATAGLLALLFFSKTVKFKMDRNHFWMVSRAIASLAMLYIVQLLAKTSVNFGLIVSAAYAIMVPIVTIIMYLLYKEVISAEKLIGMGLAVGGVYLMMK